MTGNLAIVCKINHVHLQCKVTGLSVTAKLNTAGQSQDKGMFHFIKISPVWDWRSNLHNWRFCQVQSCDTKKIWPDQI